MKKLRMRKRFLKCTENHVPNETTKKALETVALKKGLKKAATVEELFKQLSNPEY